MKSIKFRYNKYSPGVLYMMLVFGVVLGLLFFYAFLVLSGMEKGPEYGPAYFREHPKHAVYLIFGLIPIAMLLPAWIAAKCWGNRDEEAELKLYEDYAVLCFRNKEVRIEKGMLQIKIPKPHPYWYTTYILKAPKHRIVLVTSVKEAKEKRGSWLSLDTAMDELSVYRKLKKGEQKENSTVEFYGLNIVLGVTNPGVFDESPYYVDYESVVTIPGAPFVTCMIRERKNPVHVVGDMGIDIRFSGTADLDETNLKEQAILEIIELDEQVEL